LILSLHLK